MYKDNLKKAAIAGYKLITFVMLWITFMLVMSRVNYALWDPTRTAIVTTGAFTIVFLMMQNIYGNFEIGQRKSKPVFLSTMISVLIADFFATVTMLIMGLVEFNIGSILLTTILHFILVYFLQGLLIWVMAHVGNDLYFKLFEPSKLLVINYNDELHKKINNYLCSHDKQYEIIKTIKQFTISDLNKDNIDTIYAIGLNPYLESELIEYCYKNGLHLILNATSSNFILAKHNTFVIDDVLLVDIRPKKVSVYQMVVKRLMDIVGSLLLLLVSVPIYLIIFIAIKFDDNGPVLFTQDRYTKDGRIFKIYKFRSMVVDADNKSATVEDDRITKVGHIIRKLRIDELPQAINILKGDISIVGPRPESVSNVEKYRKELPDFDLRLQVKGGLTGYAQIFGKYNTTPEMKLLLDLQYIENFSLVEDIKLILQTLMVFVRSDSTEGFES